jgi:hypothetical protein
MKTAMLTAALGLMVASSAQAGLLPTQVTVVPDGGNFRWTYAIVLPTDMQLQAGNYFTIYDFNGYVDGSIAGANSDWTATVVNSGVTPALVNPNDDPNTPNLVFTYTGATIPAGQLGLGNFVALSTFSQKTESDFAAETFRSSDGLKDSNITTTDVPVGQLSNVPEPATLALAALGLPMLGLARLRRKLA